jgi:protein phosphatase
VGDSRVYQLRGESLYQLTFDHSLVWEMRAAGELSDESANSGAIPKNVITRSLGPNAHVQVDIEGPFPVQKGDRFLVCSDGLSGQITDEEIAVIMASLPPQEAGQLMIDLSNLRGGPDNITAVIVHALESSGGSGSEAPISTRRTGGKGRFSPALAIVTAVCLVAGLALFLLGNTPLGIVASILGFVALATGLAQMTLGSRSSNNAGRYGNGPYRHYKATATKSLFEHMAGTMRSLREASDERGWKIDWATLDDKFSSASKALEAGNKKQAIATLGRVIIDLMGQIRRQRNDEASDSAVDL